ncbi:MAG: class I SAM-dependent methyltransferase [Candidatus Gracilibacteria bacterium]|jgi:cyclopropane fatty-acyl-phospholipid synthase-like methyltransferase
MNITQYQELLQRYINHSDEKQVVAKKIVQQSTNFPVPSRILDVGCGTGLISNAMADLGHKVTAIDLKNSFVASPNSKNPVTFIKTDVFAFKQEQKFDLIIAAYVFWEIPMERWEALMDHLFGLLNTGGKIFVIDTINDTPYDNIYVDFNIWTAHQPISKSNDELKDYWYEFLDEKKYAYKKNIFETHITAKDPEEMYGALEFFFQDKSKSLYQSQKNRFLESFTKNQTKKGIVLRICHSLDVIAKGL